jgi:hypothetical protein
MHAPANVARKVIENVIEQEEGPRRWFDNEEDQEEDNEEPNQVIPFHALTPPPSPPSLVNERAPPQRKPTGKKNNVRKNPPPPDEDEEDTFVERELPNGCDGWEDARELYDEHGPGFAGSWQDAPEPVRVWLGGLKTDYREEFKPLDEMGPANVGALHRVFAVVDGPDIAAALWMLADHDEDVATAMWEAVEKIVHIAYGVTPPEMAEKKPRKKQ